MKTRIYYDDTDAGGIVYHANYLKYCERARSELFFAQGIKPFEGDASGFVVRKAECDFLGSARLGDMIEVQTTLINLKRVTCTIRQTIYLKEKKIFEALITLAYISEGKPTAIPQKFLEVLRGL